MPVPDELKKTIYKEVGTYDLTVKTANPKGSERPSVTKTFHAYLELDFQAKHDRKISAYCKEHGIDCRPTFDAQVARPAKDPADIFAFYREKGQIASENAAQVMHERWASNEKDAAVFKPGAKTIIAVQGRDQRDGYGYDVSLWYDVEDVYVSFHCYPKD